MQIPSNMHGNLKAKLHDIKYGKFYNFASKLGAHVSCSASAYNMGAHQFNEGIYESLEAN